jgi:hypothetical protein
MDYYQCGKLFNFSFMHPIVLQDIRFMENRKKGTAHHLLLFFARYMEKQRDDSRLYAFSYVPASVSLSCHKK